MKRAAGRTRTDRIRNKTVEKQFHLESVVKIAERRALKWFGHGARMDLERKPKP